MERSHRFQRITSCRRAFFSLLGAGLCKDGVSPKTAAELWRKICNPVLTYSCETVNLTANNRKNLDKIQAKLLKVSLGLPTCITARTTPLLDALKVPKASDIVDDNVLSLMKNIINNSSRARSFYCLLIGRISCGQYCKNVFTRSMEICHTRNMNFYSYMFNDRYAKQVDKNYCNTRFSRWYEWSH